jgi:hypothetical protein
MMHGSVHAQGGMLRATDLRRTAGHGKVAVMVLVAGCCLSVSPCQGGMISLGQAGDFKVLGLTGTHIAISGPSGVTGNLGVGPDGFGDFSGSAYVTGTTFVDPTAGIKTSGNASIHPLSGNLAPAVSDALQASAQVAALAATQTFGDIKNSATITGNGGTNVISALSIRLSGSEALTLVGGPRDTFLFNVPGRFGLSGTSAIQLSGGVLPTNVLFNILGPEDVGTVDLSGKSLGIGTFLLPERSFSLGPAVLEGSVIAGGKDIRIHSGAHVRQTPPTLDTAPEPASLTLLAVGALAFAGYGWRRSRKA